MLHYPTFLLQKLSNRQPTIRRGRSGSNRAPSVAHTYLIAGHGVDHARPKTKKTKTRSLASSCRTLISSSSPYPLPPPSPPSPTWRAASPRRPPTRAAAAAAPRPRPSSRRRRARRRGACPSGATGMLVSGWGCVGVRSHIDAHLCGQGRHDACGEPSASLMPGQQAPLARSGGAASRLTTTHATPTSPAHRRARCLRARRTRNADRHRSACGRGDRSLSAHAGPHHTLSPPPSTPQSNPPRRPRPSGQPPNQQRMWCM